MLSSAHLLLATPPFNNSKRDPKLCCIGNEHVSLLAYPPGSQVSGALQFIGMLLKILPVGEAKRSSCGWWSGGRVGAEVDGVEDDMAFGVEIMYRVELVLILECGLKFVLVMNKLGL
jgi:hypothetical protein